MGLHKNDYKKILSFFKKDRFHTKNSGNQINEVTLQRFENTKSFKVLKTFYCKRSVLHIKVSEYCLIEVKQERLYNLET